MSGFSKRSKLGLAQPIWRRHEEGNRNQRRAIERPNERLLVPFPCMTAARQEVKFGRADVSRLQATLAAATKRGIVNLGETACSKDEGVSSSLLS